MTVRIIRPDLFILDYTGALYVSRVTGLATLEKHVYDRTRYTNPEKTKATPIP
jgi:hypothetical protein